MTAVDESPWEALVTAATVGTDTRSVDLQALPDLIRPATDRLDTDDPARLLLEVAALLTTARRAGHPADIAPARVPPPAPADTTPALAAGGARILMLLAERSAALLSDALEQIERRGFRLPEPLLPEFLTAAARNSDLRPATAAVLGHRGRWLAEQNPDWSWVAADPQIAEGSVTDDRVWQTGGPAERRLWFTAARRRYPAVARDLLIAGWALEAPDDRAPLLESLAPDLSPGDEPFLEAALDDRRGGVRTVARTLLARLPDSRWSARMTSRAHAAVRVELRLLRRRVLVVLPSTCDEAMQRDGIAAAPPPGSAIGERAWWLQQIVAAAPLSTWALPPGQLLSLPVVDAAGADYAGELQRGWEQAAAQQHDADWARALLGSSHPPPDRRPVAAALLAVLPVTERLTMVTRWLPVSDLSLVELVRDLRPWPDDLAEAVLHRLQRVSPAEQSASVAVLPLLARRLPVERSADAAATLYGVAAAPTAEDRWRRVLTAAAEVVMLRRRLLEELT